MEKYYFSPSLNGRSMKWENNYLCLFEDKELTDEEINSRYISFKKDKSDKYPLLTIDEVPIILRQYPKMVLYKNNVDAWHIEDKDFENRVLELGNAVCEKVSFDDSNDGKFLIKKVKKMIHDKKEKYGRFFFYREGNNFLIKESKELTFYQIKRKKFGNKKLYSFNDICVHNYSFEDKFTVNVTLAEEEIVNKVWYFYPEYELLMALFGYEVNRPFYLFKIKNNKIQFYFNLNDLTYKNDETGETEEYKNLLRIEDLLSSFKNIETTKEEINQHVLFFHKEYDLLMKAVDQNNV